MKKSVSILFLFLLLWSCTDDNPSGPDPDDFNREAILVNWADNIILPSLQSFSTTAGELQTAGSAFEENPGQQTLEEFRSAWREAYLSWQHVSVFQMIDDTQFQFRNSMNLYPLCTSELNQPLPPSEKCTPEIQKNIEGVSYNLELPEQMDVQGFPALDYLLNGLGETDSEIVEFYTTHEQANSYRTYILDLVNRIDELAEDVLEHWESGYRDEFVSNSGSGANSSLNRMVNNYIYYYEKHLRAGKIGNPAGVFSPTPLPNRVEAFYSNGFSKVLFMEALDAAQNFFNGRHFDSQQTGESLATYLDFLNTMKNGADLAGLINNQFDAARAQAEELNDNFAAQVESDNTKMLETYDELQKNVVLLKTDMVQALNISIGYQDADGD